MGQCAAGGTLRRSNSACERGEESYRPDGRFIARIIAAASAGGPLTPAEEKRVEKTPIAITSAR